MKKDKTISDPDIQSWKDFLENPKDIYDKEEKEKKNQSLKRFKFDLHGFTLDKANKKVEEIILFCVEKKIKEILLITGKGLHSNIDEDVFKSNTLGKLKYSIPEYIKSKTNLSNYISSINDADKKDGGQGTLHIRLKKL